MNAIFAYLLSLMAVCYDTIFLHKRENVNSAQVQKPPDTGREGNGQVCWLSWVPMVAGGVTSLRPVGDSEWPLPLSHFFQEGSVV